MFDPSWNSAMHQMGFGNVPESKPANDLHDIADEAWLRKVFGEKLQADLGFGFRIQFYSNVPPSLEYERGKPFQHGYEYAETGLPYCRTKGEVLALCRAVGFNPEKAH